MLRRHVSETAVDAFGRVRSAPMRFFAKPIARGIADNVMVALVTLNLKHQSECT